MRKVIIYIAASADGFIARKDGSLDWLPQFGKEDYGYTKFYNSVDSIIMGRKTYKQILQFGKWPYPNKECFVVSSKPGKSKNATFVKNPAALVRKLKKSKGKTIWVVGGGKLNTSLIKAGLVDKLMLFLFPVLLGKGIPMLECEAKLKLTQSKTYKTGGIQLNYKFT